MAAEGGAAMVTTGVDPASLFLVVAEVGAGATATVFKAVERSTGALVALKRVALQDVALEAPLLLNELSLMRNYPHALVAAASGAFLFADASTGATSLTWVCRARAATPAARRSPPPPPSLPRAPQDRHRAL